MGKKMGWKGSLVGAFAVMRLVNLLPEQRLSTFENTSAQLPEASAEGVTMAPTEASDSTAAASNTSGTMLYRREQSC